MTTAVETVHLTRRYGNLVAVDDLNLVVPTGSIFGLIGPNGAGKTTTLRMLAGLQAPSSGEIRFHGKDAGQDWDHFRREIGYMPDFFGVYEDMLVWEYLDFFAGCHKLPTPRRAQVVNELLALVDLSDKRDAYVESLSRGMRQRLCLAHALVHDPQILLLDEPASGLDPRARVEMRELLIELGAMGKTIIVSSHILAELAELCDSLGIIEHGKLVAGGPLAQITRQAQQGRILQIKLLSDPEAARILLAAHPGVGQIRHMDSVLDLDFVGEDADVAALLAVLVGAGHQVVTFNEENSDLEEVFLRLTRGE
ncbi:MAG: ABC transporter ATP-binding protein [Caldilineaceae bacterium]|nr:ABC transporter ATP-binding protein [Caldilineaceae bacterium]